MSDIYEYNSVKEYFDAQPEQAKKALLEMKTCIFKVEPNDRIS